MMYYDITKHANNKNREVLEKWCRAIKYKHPIGYYNDLGEYKMVIYTEHPGIMIGKAGVYVDLLKEILRREFYHDYTIEFVEIRGGIVNLNINSSSED